MSHWATWEAVGSSNAATTRDACGSHRICSCGTEDEIEVALVSGWSEDDHGNTATHNAESEKA